VPAIQELLEPESWGKVLEVYARTVDLGVAIVGRDGRLIGRCHNPKPIWSLARAARPDWGAGCLFCLNSDRHCTAIEDARRTGDLTVAMDDAGFVHVAVPLVLDGNYLGALLAGQAFDGYPQILKVERVAKSFGLSPQTLWDLARRRIPISRANLMIFGNLLSTLSQAFLIERNSAILKRDLAASNERLQLSVLDLKAAQVETSQKVAELAQINIEKDILLSEVHHRVNNNLQVIASLLRMEAAAGPDDQVAIALRGSQFRVESMALIHAQLYGATDWSAIDFAEYVEELAGNLFRSYGVDHDRIALHTEVQAFSIGVDKAIPAGLILNELISNALKHAFPDNRAGSIVVKGHFRDGQIELSVEDDGAGTHPSAEPRKHKSLGLTIVDILCKQLKGTLLRSQSNDGTGGCIFSLSFPNEPRSSVARAGGTPASG
jgi:two-component sensor histidine kinase/ligand-binding sensor protein